MTAIKPLVGVSACRIEVNGLSMQRCSEKYLMAAAGEVAATPMIIPSLPNPLDVASMIARLDGLLLTGSPSNVEPGHYDGPDSVEGTAHDPARDGTTLPLIRAAVAAGGRLASGIVEEESPEDPIRPIAVLDCPADAELVQGDHFGPALAVVPVETLEEALELHRSIPQHLATSVWTRAPHRARELMPTLGSATVLVNDVLVPTAHPAASIRGTRESGWGGSRGREGLLAMSRPVHVSRTSTRLRIPPEPPSDSQLAMLERMSGISRGSPHAPAPDPTLRKHDELPEHSQ